MWLGLHGVLFYRVPLNSSLPPERWVTHVKSMLHTSRACSTHRPWPMYVLRCQAKSQAAVLGSGLTPPCALIKTVLRIKDAKADSFCLAHRLVCDTNSPGLTSTGSGAPALPTTHMRAQLAVLRSASCPLQHWTHPNWAAFLFKQRGQGLQMRRLQPGAQRAINHRLEH